MIKLLLFEIVVVIITINVNLKRRMCFQWGNNKKGAINMRKILFIEDDHDYRNAILAVLENAGYIVDATESPIDGMELFALKEYDLVISDLMLNEIDGIRFLSYIKRLNPIIKTMILTAEPTMDSELAALDIYVDRYLVKETRVDVLLKYIDVILKQDSPELAKHQRVLKAPEEALELNLLGRKVTKNGEEVKLTPKEFEILKILLVNRGQALTRDEILAEVWDINYEDIDIRVIDVHIKKIRQKLKLQSIISVHGYGYKWD